MDEQALVDALRSGHLAAAALDVHNVEPYFRGSAASGALGATDVPNLYCTPHLAWFSPQSRVEMRQKGAEAARGVLTGGRLRNVVNLRHLEPAAAARRGALV